MILRSGRTTIPLQGIERPFFRPPPPPSPVQKPQPRLQRAKLTRRNLEKLELEMPKAKSRVKSVKSVKSLETALDSNTSKNTTTTDKSFGEQLRKNGVYFDRPQARKPTDLDAIIKAIEEERESQAPSEEEFEEFIYQVDQADNEDSVVTNVWDSLAKRPRNSVCHGYNQNTNYPWTEVESAAREHISDPKPDISESFRIDQYPQEALDDLGPALQPTAYKHAMPSFCVELKGPDGTMLSAKKQAGYDGAVMTDASWAAHQYMKAPADDFLGKTQALTATFGPPYLHIFANHATTVEPDNVEKNAPAPVDGAQSANATNNAPASTDAAQLAILTNSGPTANTNTYPQTLHFHQYPVKSFIANASPEEFRAARRAVRNAQTWARERAKKKRDDLHEYVKAKRIARAGAAAAAATAAAAPAATTEGAAITTEPIIVVTPPHSSKPSDGIVKQRRYSRNDKNRSHAA